MAASLALDRQALNEAETLGLSKPVGSIVPREFEFALPFEPHAYDPAKAKKLLAQAGYAKGFSLTMQLPPVNYAQQSGAFIQSELGQVGIKVKIQNIDFPLWINRVFIGGNYDLTIIAHVEARDLIKYADPKYYWHYDNKTVQKLIAEGDAAPTDAQWIADYRKVERIITTDAVNDWLFLLPNLEVVRKGITGYPTNALSLSFDVTGLRRE